MDPIHINDIFNRSVWQLSNNNDILIISYRTRRQAQNKCAILMSSAFSRCHRVVSPEPFLSSCVYDLCVCQDDPTCLCDIISAYAHECSRAGVRVEWRSQNLCAFDCDRTAGLVFDECGPVCPRTCDHVNVTSSCFKPCVPSCQCTADKVLHDGRCISPQRCPHVEAIPVDGF